MLLSRAGYPTTPACTVAEGLDQLHDHTHVLLDLNLPDGLGTTILQKIRDDHLSALVAITTGTTDTDTLDEARNLHPDLLMHKPINVLTLLEWLAAPSGHGSGIA